ncbi:MAG TPA: type II CAAX endopeptidase family protein [Rubrobacteraceae bacterium]|nr:type II CAAX endopeptidase family protein [Rubrobacteraceae bacterium]
MRPFFDEGTGRLRAPWRLLLQYLAYTVAVPLFANLLAGAFLMAGMGAGSSGTSALAGSPLLPVIGGVAGLGGALLSVWLAGRFLDRRPFAEFGFHLSGGWWLDLLFGMALGALLMTTVFLVQSGLGWVTVTGSFESLVPGAPFWLAVLVPATLFVCVGFYEELVSRGYQLRNAAEGLNSSSIGPRGAVLLAWALSSAFFGYLHAANPNATILSTANVALAGLMLGCGYVLTGELAIPIGLHVTWNFFQGTVFGFPVSGLRIGGATFLSIEQGGPDLWTGGPFGPEGGLLAPAAMALGILLTALWVRLRRGRVAIHAPIAKGPKPERASSPYVSSS